ncbi:hypothetical protein IW140_005548 [Coemansia sp. RSA 1813]|nr:hypothetical protein EV178_005539 [Coemansia sp. RSA 1646]KAJ1766069.1 hypothetical protein LPJ74_006062 [Coemansia sp. RSA 1843]KAJ2211394.1 hypothetical protein EV179_005532 [Coemansia sp. RSA 487]KAJ2564965.1 hypothetical protein IW140_005548 [Coemansia sp. RSA 1813]
MALKDKTKTDKVKSGKVFKTHAPKKKLSEIDDIFNSTPKHNKLPKNHIDRQKEMGTTLSTESKKSSSVKIVDATNAGKSTANNSSNSSNKKNLPPKDDDFADSRGKNSKYTEDGMRVYYMDDLRIGEGEGDTDLCPFDCDCCF